MNPQDLKPGDVISGRVVSYTRHSVKDVIGVVFTDGSYTAYNIKQRVDAKRPTGKEPTP